MGNFQASNCLAKVWFARCPWVHLFVLCLFWHWISSAVPVHPSSTALHYSLCQTLVTLTQVAKMTEAHWPGTWQPLAILNGILFPFRGANTEWPKDLSSLNFKRLVLVHTFSKRDNDTSSHYFNPILKSAVKINKNIPILCITGNFCMQKVYWQLL